MSMVHSQKSIGELVGVAVRNALNHSGYDTKLERMSGIVNQEQVDVMQGALDRHLVVSRRRVQQQAQMSGMSAEMD